MFKNAKINARRDRTLKEVRKKLIAHGLYSASVSWSELIHLAVRISHFLLSLMSGVFPFRRGMSRMSLHRSCVTRRPKILLVWDGRVPKSLFIPLVFVFFLKHR